MKNLKSLFIKEDEEEAKAPEVKHGFPVSEPVTATREARQSNTYLSEIVEVYEKGLQSINLPGYDFYDFYLAIHAAGAQSEPVYKMAFQMGKTIDSTVTVQKLLSDADFYISKINEVHRNYADQGRQKLEGIDAQERAERQQLNDEAVRTESEISRLRQQIMQLETQLAAARSKMEQIGSQYKPQQQMVQQKLSANEQAMQLSVQKLNAVKEGIMKYLK